MEEKLALSVAEASRELGICLKSMYRSSPLLFHSIRRKSPCEQMKNW